MSRQNSFGKKNKGLSIWTIIAIFFIVNFTGAYISSDLGGLIFIIAVIAFVVIKLKKKNNPEKAEKVMPNTVDHKNFKKWSSDSEQTAVTRHAPRPEPIRYNNLATEENFNHDRQRRIKQLDDFLKNGIIDKDEYKVLVSRYERDI